jgi:hypothetical protein
MTIKSAAAMELTRVDVVLAAAPVPARAAAVAKKLTDPPIKDAAKQAAACAASGTESHMPGNARQIKKESRHPAMDPTEAKPKGNAKSRTTWATEWAFFCFGWWFLVVVAVDSDSNNRASEAGRRVLQQTSYITWLAGARPVLEITAEVASVTRMPAFGSIQRSKDRPVTALSTRADTALPLSTNEATMGRAEVCKIPPRLVSR